MLIPVSALVSYEESGCESAMNVTWDVRLPQPFSKHVLVFIDIFQPYGFLVTQIRIPHHQWFLCLAIVLGYMRAPGPV